MLTNDDLRKIGDLIDERLESKLEEKLAPIRKDIKSLKNSHTKLRKDMKLVINFLDRERVSHERRITKIEDHLGLPSIK